MDWPDKEDLYLLSGVANDSVPPTGTSNPGKAKKRFGILTDTNIGPLTNFPQPTSCLTVLSQEQRESRFSDMQEPLIDMMGGERPNRIKTVPGLSLSTNRTPPQVVVSVSNRSSQETQLAGLNSKLNLKPKTEGDNVFPSLTSTNLALLNKPTQSSTDLLNFKSVRMPSKAEPRTNLNAVQQTRLDVQCPLTAPNVHKARGSHHTGMSKPQLEEQHKQLPSVRNSPPKEPTTTTLPIATTKTTESWLTPRLLLGGMPEPLAHECEQKLVYNEGFSNVRDFAECPPTLFHRAYLTSIGVTGLGTQQQLLRLHGELHAQYQQSVVIRTTAVSAPVSHKTISDVPATNGCFSNICATSIRQDNNNSITFANATASNNKRVRSDSMEYGDIIEHQYVPAPPCKKM